MMEIFVITDNRAWFDKINNWRNQQSDTVDIFCSPKGQHLFNEEICAGLISTLNVKSEYKKLINNYKIGFSCHCKQVFPPELVGSIKCFNVHPGMNPYNRGWFPQVFSILNGLPSGATIHEMNSEIDSGPIIAQREVQILDDDTSKGVYRKILSTEFALFDENISRIIQGKYTSSTPGTKGNYNSIYDFKELCQIDLDKQVTFREAIDYLRAMTFDGYENAYFYSKNGQRIYVSINLNAEK